MFLAVALLHAVLTTPCQVGGGDATFRHRHHTLKALPTGIALADSGLNPKVGRTPAPIGGVHHQLTQVV